MVASCIHADDIHPRRWFSGHVRMAGGSSFQDFGNALDISACHHAHRNSNHALPVRESPVGHLT